MVSILQLQGLRDLHRNYVGNLLSEHLYPVPKPMNNSIHLVPMCSYQRFPFPEFFKTDAFHIVARLFVPRLPHWCMLKGKKSCCHGTIVLLEIESGLR